MSDLRYESFSIESCQSLGRDSRLGPHLIHLAATVFAQQLDGAGGRHAS